MERTALKRNYKSSFHLINKANNCFLNHIMSPKAAGSSKQACVRHKQKFQSAKESQRGATAAYVSAIARNAYLYSCSNHKNNGIRFHIKRSCPKIKVAYLAWRRSFHVIEKATGWTHFRVRRIILTRMIKHTMKWTSSTSWERVQAWTSTIKMKFTLAVRRTTSMLFKSKASYTRIRQMTFHSNWLTVSLGGRSDLQLQRQATSLCLEPSLRTTNTNSASATSPSERLSTTTTAAETNSIIQSHCSHLCTKCQRTSNKK